MEVIEKTRKKLAINYERTCNCEASHINCLSAKQWLKNQLGVWQFNYEARDIRDKNLHPATFPISLSKRIIELFTHEGELVFGRVPRYARVGFSASTPHIAAGNSLTIYAFLRW